MCDASGDAADALDDVLGLRLQAVGAAIEVASDLCGLAPHRAPAAPQRGGAATLEPVEPLRSATAVRVGPHGVGRAVPRLEGGADRNQDRALGLAAQRFEASRLGVRAARGGAGRGLGGPLRGTRRAARRALSAACRRGRAAAALLRAVALAGGGRLLGSGLSLRCSLGSHLSCLFLWLGSRNAYPPIGETHTRFVCEAAQTGEPPPSSGQGNGGLRRRDAE